MNVSIFRRLPVLLLACAWIWAAPVADADLVDVELVGVDYNTGVLYSISTVNAGLTPIGNTGITNLGSLAFHQGSLYGVTAGSAVLYKINPGDPAQIDMLDFHHGYLNTPRVRMAVDNPRQFLIDLFTLRK